MVDADPRTMRGLIPLLSVSVVVVLVAFGLARGLWLPNIHNGLLATAFTLVGAYVLYQRPGHREGRLFLATGVVEGVLFLGRQLGRFPNPGGSRWWGWLGVWPTALALALTTLSVICFPDGRLPTRNWRWVAGAVVVLTAGCATLSATWPVEYDSAGVLSTHPVEATSPASIDTVWSAVAHPVYIGCQVLWVITVVVRWRTSGAQVRRQLRWLLSAAAVSVVALVIGLMAGHSPRAGLLAVSLVPVTAGLAIVHGQHTAAYSALTWLSRARAEPADLPTDLARAVADALVAPGAALWVGGTELHAIGVWPENGDAIAPTTSEELSWSGQRHVRVVSRGDARIGAITVERSRTDKLSLAEERLFGDLASQAALVIDHIGLADIVARQQRAGHLATLSARERSVLELMANGRSNAAICDELHLSIKTVEPVVSAIFAKLGLHADAHSNRRVLAVLAYLRT